MKRISNSTSEYRSLQFSFYTIIALMICSLIFNEMTNSNIIEVDAGYYVISAIIGLVTIYISKLKDKPKDDNHPLGFSGYVPILNLIRSFMIILICIKGIGGAIGDIYNGPSKTNHSIMFTYAGITLFFNSIAFMIIHKAANKLDSALLKTDALEWKTDVGFNISIILAVLLSYALTFTSYDMYANYVDPVFCIIFSIAMGYYPVLLFTENVKLLSVSSIDTDLQEKIIESFNKELTMITHYNPKFTVLHIGGVLWVNIELDVPDTEELIHTDYMLIKKAGESILSKITSDHKISFLFNYKYLNIK